MLKMKLKVLVFMPNRTESNAEILHDGYKHRPRLFDDGCMCGVEHSNSAGVELED